MYVSNNSINVTEHILRSLCYSTRFQRFLIIFGSIGFLWSIIGLVFLLIQLHDHCLSTMTYHRSCPYVDDRRRLLTDRTYFNDELPLDNQFDIDRTSVATSMSWISNHTRTNSRQMSIVPGDTHRIEYRSSMNTDNSTSTDQQLSLTNVATSSIFDSSSISTVNCQHRTNSVMSSSQMTGTIYCSSKSSVKSLILPIVMITDCDRLQTDIIELEQFEPDRVEYVRYSYLRQLLNDRMPRRYSSID
jgi:hypothetical protein